MPTPPFVFSFNLFYWKTTYFISVLCSQRSTLFLGMVKLGITPVLGTGNLRFKSECSDHGALHRILYIITGDDIISIRKRSNTFTVAVVMLYTTALSLSAWLSAGNSVDGEAIIETTVICESTTTTSTTPATSLTPTTRSIRVTVPITTTAVSETTTAQDTSQTTQSQTTRTAIQTTKLTTSQTTTSSTTTSSTTTTEKSELTVDMTDSESQSESTTTTTTTTTEPSLTFLGNFRGTYYRGSTNPCRGGSGRTLIDCAAGAMTVKGSVACKYIYQNYGYSLNGRTTIYIEVSSYPSMSGWYYVDDCCASYSVVDFYYPVYSRCPFQNAGVISVKVYI